MNWTLFWAILFVLEMLVVAQALLAVYDDIFTVQDVLWDMWSFPKGGLPFIAHGGMWGDLFFISPLVAYIVAGQKTTRVDWQIILAIVAGVIVSDALHKTYTASKIPEAHVRNGKLTWVGKVHSAYMALGFAALFLYFFRAIPQTEFVEMWLVSLGLVLHVTVGTHVVLGLIKPKWYPGDPLHSAGTWGAIGGTVVILSARMVWFTIVGY